MTIGKRKGIAAKGAFNPAQPGDKVGGSLSKGDHWYIQQAFGMGADPGTPSAVSPPAPYADPTGHTASGGQISDYATPPGAVYRAHVFRASGTFGSIISSGTVSASGAAVGLATEINAKASTGKAIAMAMVFG